MTTTAAKRSASAGFALPGLVTLPFADGTNDQRSRWHGAFCYFLGSDEPAVPTVPSDGWTLGARRSVFQLSANDVIFDSGRMRVWRMKRR
jgi:hypothetical protein